MPDRRTLLAALAVGVVAVAARLPGMIEDPLWQDEVASARILLEPSPGAALERIERTESTPPGWYLLAWTVHRAGLSIAGTRVLSVLAGAALAALLVVYGRRLLPLLPATAAGLFVALGAQFVSRGHELRAYSVFALLALVFAWTLETSARTPTRGRLVALAATVTAGLLTHYFVILLLLAGLVWLWTSRRARARPTAAVVIGAVPPLAWLPSFLEQYDNQRFAWITGFDAGKAISVYSSFFWNPGALYVRTDHVELGPAELAARALVLLVVLAGCIVLARRSDEGRLAALLAVLPILLAGLLWLAGADIFTTRNLLCAGPFAALALAAALSALPYRAALPATGVALALVVAGLAYERTLAPPPYERLAAALVDEGWRLGDPVAFYRGAHELSYFGSSYALRSPVGWYLPGHPLMRLPTVEGSICGRAFVVAPVQRPSALVADGDTQEVVDSITVARIACTPGLEKRALADGAVWFVSMPQA